MCNDRFKPSIIFHDVAVPSGFTETARRLWSKANTIAAVAFVHTRTAELQQFN